MNLLEEYSEKFTILDKQSYEDGLGGYAVRYIDGAEIDVSVSYNASIQTEQAKAQGTTAVYVFLTPKAINLQYHDVLRRKSDNKIFRVTSDGDDNRTPDSAGLDIRAVTAEEWSLPSND